MTINWQTCQTCGVKNRICNYCETTIDPTIETDAVYMIRPATNPSDTVGDHYDFIVHGRCAPAYFNNGQVPAGAGPLTS